MVLHNQDEKAGWFVLKEYNRVLQRHATTNSWSATMQMKIRQPEGVATKCDQETDTLQTNRKERC